jgi:thiaminase/transcriptional activator TenA
MKFTELLWSSITPIYDKILEHPFIKGLTDGALEEAAFRYYVIQDALYLKDFARGLAILGAKSPEDDWLIMFNEHAKSTIIVERALHDSFFKDWKLDAKTVYETPMAPYNLLYTSFLIRIAYERPFYEVLGAFLPCYWIYFEVGKHLEKTGSSVEIYQRWIDTYASEEFEKIVKEVLDIMNSIAGSLTPTQKEQVKQHFIMTSKFEYMFWDMGYRKQGWEV